MSGTENNIKIICSIRFSLLITIDRFYKLFLAEGAFVNRRPEIISPLFFIPLPPSHLRPFGAPPSRGRRECPRSPFPWKGLPSAARRGWLPFWGGEAASSLPSPSGKGDRVAVNGVPSYIVDLRRISPLVFHAARTLSGSLRSPPSPRGEGFMSGIALSSSNLRPFGAPPSS